MADISLSLDEIRQVAEMVQNNPEVRRTPMLKDAQFCFSSPLKSCSLHFKLESMQLTGSFKIRGVVNQLELLKSKFGDSKGIATYSGGNYGKSFATVVNRFKIPSVVIMPQSAPADRVQIIQDFGSRVEQYENMNILEEVAINYSKKGMLYVNPFDDMDLIRGYGSVALEILQLVPNPDIVIVPCGGGGLISGVAATMRLAGLNSTKIYGINPTGALAMYKSFQIGKPAQVTNPKSVAGGLCPPAAGKYTYACCRKYVDDILLVTDEEIIAAVRAFFDLGLIVEPAGAAALAALMSGKVPVSVEGKTVVIVVSGGNITMKDMDSLMKNN